MKKKPTEKSFYSHTWWLVALWISIGIFLLRFSHSSPSSRSGMMGRLHAINFFFERDDCLTDVVSIIPVARKKKLTSVKCFNRPNTYHNYVHSPDWPFYGLVESNCDCVKHATCPNNVGVYLRPSRARKLHSSTGIPRSRKRAASTFFIALPSTVI